MINLFDILDRSYSGEKITDEKQWDMRVWRKAVELSKKYNIKYDPQYAIVCDDEMADRCFEAAVVLLSDVGVYNITTQRVIRLEEEEIRKAVSQLRDELILGEGRDRFLVAHRNMDNYDDVKLMAGHFSCTDEVGPRLFQAMAEVQSLDILEGYNFFGVQAGRAMEGMVHETLATKAELIGLRKAIARAGRPGLSLVYYPTSPNPAAMIAALDPDNGLRKTDVMELSPLPELKIENNLLAVAIATAEYGASIFCPCVSFLYGFGGGPDEEPIIATAQCIQAYLTYRADFLLLAAGNPIDIETQDLPAVLWCKSMAHVAMVRNVRSPFFSPIAPGPEPNNENSWREYAAAVMMAVSCGSHLDIMRPTRPYRENLFTPLILEFCSEIAGAMVKNKMTREDANKIIMDGLVPKYKPIYDVPANKRYPLLKGKPFEALYDLNTLKPNKEHLDSYHMAREELIKLGFEFEW